MKIGLISLGCPKNLVDSEVMLGLAREAGHDITRDPAAADVLVVNTCAFIDGARRESVDTILEGPRTQSLSSAESHDARVRRPARRAQVAQEPSSSSLALYEAPGACQTVADRGGYDAACCSQHRSPLLPPHRTIRFLSTAHAMWNSSAIS